MTIENIAVFGAGRLGSQIAFHAAFRGFKVVVFEVDNQAACKARERIIGIATSYIRDLAAPEIIVSRALGNLSYSVNMSEAISNADLMIEALPSRPAIKKSFYQQIGAVAPRHTIFAACSSVLAAELATCSGRPKRFLSFGFSLDIWRAESMKITAFGDSDTDAVYAAIAFMEELELAVLPIGIVG